jgi:hypothetical protein
MANKYWIGLVTPGDYGVAGNWSPSGVPIANDVVYIPAGSPSITAGLNQSAVSLDGFFVEPGYAGQIGSGTANLQIALDAGEPFVFAGINTAYIDLGASATTAVINNTAPATGGGFGLYLLGTALTVLTVNKGVVGFAARGGEASTAGVVNVNWVTSQPTDSTLVCGSGVTLTTVNQTGGNLTIQSAATTVSVLSGTCFILGTGTVTTLTNNGGTVYPSSTGTITTVAANSGTTDFTRSLSARTVTTMTSAGQGAVIVYDESFLTITNKLDVANVPMRIEIRGLNS